ncbi:Dicer-like protein 1 [Tulasnella sp. 403]|nr:Dicer-like protein 1 [Tulasnella sp. 403]
MDSLIPRAYQSEILLKGMRENVIAVLPTGSGKTLISALLIRWVAAQPIHAGKKIFFLVPKVPLVQQQQDFVASQTTGLKIKGYIGAMGVDLWDREEWLKEINGHDILVMTPAILVRLLLHTYISIPEISLIVFDEVHHGRSNHPYAQIMRDYYFRYPANERPKIFGMTASPIWNVRKAVQGLKELTDTMNAVILTANANKDDLAIHAPRAQTEYVLYDPPSRATYTDSLWTQLTNSKLKLLQNFIRNEKAFESVEMRYHHAVESLGVLAADRYLNTYIEEKVKSWSMPAKRDYFRGHDVEMKRCIDAIKQFLDEHGLKRFQTESLPHNCPYVTPKVWRLAQLLDDNKKKTPSIQAIVFVERRDEVHALTWLLPKLQGLDWIRCKGIVGHGDSDISNNGMNVKIQERVVLDFRNGEFNVLIASSVAEEGLDFQSLSLVVKFDDVQNLVSFAQSRGRARKAGSGYYAMVRKNDQVAIARFKHILKSEEAVSNWLSQDDSERPTPDDDENPKEISNEERKARYITSKGAVLTYSAAVVLISELCSSLPTDEFAGNLKPTYVGEFQVFLRLPPVIPVPPPRTKYLEYQGPLCRTKGEAKRAVCFMAVKRLHKLGVFNDYLLPEREPGVDDGVDADGKQVPDFTTEKLMPVHAYVPFDDLWQPGKDVWCHPIAFGKQVICGLVIGRPVRIDDPLQYPCIGEVNVRPPIQVPFTDEEERMLRLKTMAKYSNQGVYWSITNKKFDGRESTAFLVPLHPKTLLPNYREMEQFFEIGTPLWGQRHLQSGTILGRHRRRHRILQFSRIRDDLTPLSKPIKTSGKGRELAYSSYVEFYREYYNGTKGRGPPIYGMEDDDTMLEFFVLPRARTILDNHGKQEIDDFSALPTEIMPHSAVLHMPFTLDMYRAFITFPALIRHVTSHTRAQEAIRELSLPDIAPALLVEALTLPLVYAGYDYQRLETLGDSCLKLATSVHVFTKYPYKHEGQLTALRRNSINNKYLRGRALERNLFRFVNSERVVNGRTWTTPTIDISHDPEGRPLALQNTPRKSMQDCVEATLGAAWLTGGIKMVLKTGTQFGLCFGGKEPWPGRPGTIRDKIRPGELSPASLRSLMDKMGYHFNDIYLLVEALTHPSCQLPDAQSYNRLEYLGDALIDLFVIDHLYSRFPSAQPGKLTNARSAAVCNTTLSAIALRELSLDNLVLHAATALPKATERVKAQFDGMTYEDILRSTWKIHSPKTLGDLIEAVMGAVLVDSNYDLRAAFDVLEKVMEEPMKALHPDLPLDPVSELMQYMQRKGCIRVRFKKSTTRESGQREFKTAVLMHGEEIIPPIPAYDKSLAKGLTCEAALARLQEDDQIFERLCTCAEDRLKAKREKKEADQVEKMLEMLEGEDPDFIKAVLKELPEDSEEAFVVESMLVLGRDKRPIEGGEEGEEEGEIDSDVLQSQETASVLSAIFDHFKPDRDPARHSIIMNTQSNFPPRSHSRAETPLPPPPPLRERGDSSSSQQGPPTNSSAPSVSTIQIPASSSSNVRSSPQKTQIRTYDSKLISREMDRLAMHNPTPPLHAHSHSHSHTGALHALSAAGSVSTLTLVPSLAHSTVAPALTAGSSIPTTSDDPWSNFHVHVLPLFNGEPLRMPIEDLNALVKRHIHAVVSKSPSRAISTLEVDVIDFLGTGMITLNSKLNGVDDDKLLNRVVELWGFFWDQILPYVEGVFLPLQTDALLVSLSRTPKVVRSTSPTDSTDRDAPSAHQPTLSSSPIDVRTLTLRSFRDAIILPIFERLHSLVTFPTAKDTRREYSQPRFQQMLLVLTSIQMPTVSLSMNDSPLSPGEHAITHLLRAARNPNSGSFPLNPYPNASARRRTMGPSSFSGGAPRDRRARIARKDDAFDDRVLGLFPTDQPNDPNRQVDPDETPTPVRLPTGENMQHIQRMREERQFLDSLRSPDLEGEIDKHGPSIGSGIEGRLANMTTDYDSADDKSEEEDFGNVITNVGAFMSMHLPELITLICRRAFQRAIENMPNDESVTYTLFFPLNLVAAHAARFTGYQRAYLE